MARVEVDVTEAMVTSTSGNVAVEGLDVECTRCNHVVQVCGRSEASEKRGCVMLREECPEDETNFYVVSR